MASHLLRNSIVGLPNTHSQPITLQQADSYYNNHAHGLPDLQNKLRPIMLNFYLLCFWAMLKNVPIMLNIIPMTTAIMPQFVYDFILMTR